MRNLLLSLALLFASVNVLAQAKSGFMSNAAFTGGLGSMVNETKSIPSADLMFAQISLDIGYQFGMITPLLQLDYRYMGQTSDPDDVGGNNLGGSGYLAGLGFGLAFSMISINAVYNLVGQYDLSKKTGGGTKVSYTSPNGFSLAIKYKWKANWQLLVNASLIDYEKRKAGSTETDISDNKLSQTLYGVGVGYAF